MAVYCRTRWDDGNGNGMGNNDQENEDGYLNLGKLIGASPIRGIPLTPPLPTHPPLHSRPDGS